jgi:hypothetical protein
MRRGSKSGETNRQRALGRLRKLRGMLKGKTSLLDELLRARREGEKRRIAALRGHCQKEFRRS